MARTLFSSLFVVLFLLAAPLPALSAGQGLLVTVSIKPIHSLVTALMQGVGTPELLVKGTETPYSAKLTQAQMKLLAKSDLIIWLGPELEGFLAEALKHITCKGRIFEMLASEEFKILPSRALPGRRDPYLWLDVRNAEEFVDAFYEQLKAVDPDNAEIYARNRTGLKERISKLDRQFEYGFRSIAAGEGWAYHDTQQYFAQSYALHLNGYLAPVPGAKADMATLLNTRNEMIAMGKSCLFTEKGMSTDKLSFLTGGTKIVVAALDSFATSFTPGPELYEQMMWHNFKAISQCFKDIGAVYTGPRVKLKKPKL